MRRAVLVAVVALLAGAAVAVAGLTAGRQAARAKPVAALKPMQRRLLSGVARQSLDRTLRPSLAPRLRAERRAPGSTSKTGCPADRGANVRVNQDCQNLTDPDLAGRGEAQNETAIAQDPNDPSRIVASSNDYRRGDANCYAYFSGDGGRSWQDSTAPMGFTRGAAFGGFARQYWQAGGDTSVAWDTKGNAYLSCQMFKRGQPVSNDPDQSSAFYVFRSTGTGGASWNFPARPVAELNDVAGTGEALLDKQYLTVDDHVGSPYQDRIYVTWTLFAADGTAYIYEAYSRDFGEHFSAPKLVSGATSTCVEAHGVPIPQGPCNNNQFSQPFTGPDGALYVVWDNFNVTSAQPGEGDEGSGGDAANRAAAPAGVDNRSQVLLARSTDGGNTFSAPVKVADFYDLPDCATYQGEDEGVACVPEKGETTNSTFRAANYPSGAVNPRDPSEVDVTFGSYLNRHSNEGNGCVPQGVDEDTLLPLYDGVKTPGACNNDVLVSRSTNAGRRFTGTGRDVRELPSVRPGDPRADQFWQWAAFDPRGRLAVSYYDRAYGDDEATGFSDVSLSGTRDGRTFATRRVTTASMPPPTQFTASFFGDYSGLSAGDVAHPFWMDTRDPELFACRDSAGNVTLPPSVCTASAPNAALANDENVYTRGLAIPLP
jgi:hypothetical protein